MSAKRKICTQCKKEKAITEYRRDRLRTDGRNSACKVCMRSLQHVIKLLEMKIERNLMKLNGFVDVRVVMKKNLYVWNFIIAIHRKKILQLVKILTERGIILKVRFQNVRLCVQIVIKRFMLA